MRSWRGSGTLSILVAGVTAAGVLASPFRRTTPGRSTACSSPCSPCSPCPRSTPCSAPRPRARARAPRRTRRVLEAADREPSVRDPAEPLPAPARPTLVALEAVTARYEPTEPPVLRDFDLRLEPGSRVALLGRSGAGKTTVTNLLLRFLDPEDGRVTIAGRARDYRQEDVRATFASRPVEAHLFNSTIRANLALARPGATDAELRGARRGRESASGSTAPGRARHARRRGRRSQADSDSGSRSRGRSSRRLRCSSSTSRRPTRPQNGRGADRRRARRR